MSKREATQIVKAYAQALKKERFEFEQIYLFGSQAAGRATDLSDIDVAVVSRRPGRGKSYLQRKMRLWETAVNIDTRIEPILLSTDDLLASTTSIMGDQVRKYGVRVT
ncbi:nucleotidyltransferase domain-containing protein [Patescibacteria group bacterium]|nr:MAG: nucleotidyltransferase domain-containing protein [Patescibacteria group bacterium]